MAEEVASHSAMHAATDGGGGLVGGEDGGGAEGVPLGVEEADPLVRAQLGKGEGAAGAREHG